MPTYTVTGYQWSGFTTYATPISIVIDDDDAELDWFGGDTGTPQTAEFGGTTYTIAGAGLLPSDIQDNDGGGVTLSEDLLFMNLTGYGWVFVPMPGSVFTPGDAILSWTTGTWSDTDGVPHDDVMCFTAGTKIMSRFGPINVEAVQAGDLLSTADNGLQPVRWCESSAVGTTQLISDPLIRPIIIRRGALGYNSPCRDTKVSPQHRVVYSGWKAELYFGETEVLIPAKALVSMGLAERDDSLKPVTYVHVLLDNHEILTGDGLKSESLMPAEMALSCMTEAQKIEVEKLVPNYSGFASRPPQLARPGIRVQEAVVLA